MNWYWLKNSVVISDKLKQHQIRAKQILKPLLSCLLVLASFLSHTAPDSQLLNRLDIQRALFSGSYGSFEVDDRQIIYILQENTTAITRGVAVIIGESGAPVLNQQGLTPLATELNKIGWVTLVLPAPNIAFEAIQSSPVIEEADEPSTENASQDTPETKPTAADLIDTDINNALVSQLSTDAFAQHEQQLIALLEASTAKAAEYPGFYLVIAQGTSAAWLAKIYTEKKLDLPDALVAISPYWPDRKYNQLLPQWMAQTPMPLLDLYSDGDNDWASMTVKARAISATKSLKLHYRQRMLVGVDLVRQPSTYLSKEIYGWLSHMGW